MMLPRFFRGRGDNDSSPSTPSPQPPTVLPHHPPSSSSATGPARPIRFVDCDEKGKFVMDPEALATLQLVKEPIGVVSVCGRARQGKSFILNQRWMTSSTPQIWCCPIIILRLRVRSGLPFLPIPLLLFYLLIVSIRFFFSFNLSCNLPFCLVAVRSPFAFIFLSQDLEMSARHNELFNTIETTCGRLLLELQSDRLKKIMDYLNSMNSMCLVLGIDFKDKIREIHPILDDYKGTRTIDNGTIQKLSAAVQDLKEVKIQRLYK